MRHKMTKYTTEIRCNMNERGESITIWPPTTNPRVLVQSIGYGLRREGGRWVTWCLASQDGLDRVYCLVQRHHLASPVPATQLNQQRSTGCRRPCCLPPQHNHQHRTYPLSLSIMKSLCVWPCSTTDCTKMPIPWNHH